MVAAAGWRVRALCRELDPELFFPGKGISPTAAIGVCRRCPVQWECLHDALALPASADVGVWGGTTRSMRRTLRRILASGERVGVDALPDVEDLDDDDVSGVAV